MVSLINHGISLLERSASGGVYVLSETASRAWAVFEISAADLLLLYRSDTMPELRSARCEVIAESKIRCLGEFEERQIEGGALALLSQQESGQGVHDGAV